MFIDLNDLLDHFQTVKLPKSNVLPQKLISPVEGTSLQCCRLQVVLIYRLKFKVQ